MIEQPFFYLVGEIDAMHRLCPATEERLRPGLPGLLGFISLPGVCHWPNGEAPEAFNEAVPGFLNGL